MDSLNEVPSQTAFEGKRLTSKEQDEVYLSLAQYLLDENLHNFAMSCLTNISDKESF